MLKFAGGMMIFFGCLGLGFWYRGQLLGRVKALRMLGTVLELLESEVRYGRATLPESCRNVSARLSSPFAEAFDSIDAKMCENTGASFAEVFRECLQGPLETLPLKQEDREVFLQIASSGGYTDGQMQLRAMEQSRELMAGTVKQLERENTDKCKMAVGLGAMGGLLLIIALW